MKQKLLRIFSSWLVFILALIPLAAAGVRGGMALAENQKLQSEFAQNETKWGYGQGLPMEEINFRMYISQYTGGVHTVSGALDFDGAYEQGVTLSSPLRYYSSPDVSAKPVLELPAGTKINYKPAVYEQEHDDSTFKKRMGYGVYAFPTYDREWRYGIPFTKWGGWEPTSHVPDAERLYVRTDDLYAIYSQSLDSNPDFLAYWEKVPYTYWEKWPHAEQYMQNASAFHTRENLDKLLFYYQDWLLYQQGVYISPNLLTPVFDPLNIGLLAGSGALVIVFIAYKSAVHRKKKARP
jgi:hypothetical protein